MTEDAPGPLHDLQRYRDMLVNERRKLIHEDVFGSSAAERPGFVSPGRPPGVGHHAMIASIQNAIEAIDRAMIDEEKVRPSVFETG